MPRNTHYNTFSNRIRQYRNKVVHDVAIGNVIVGKIHLVPRKEKIQDYGDLQAVQAATKDWARLKRDFIVREEQMSADLRAIQALLNALWKRPIDKFSALFYESQNRNLLQKYNLTSDRPSNDLSDA